MRFVELEPKWLMQNGRRIGVLYRCHNPERRKWWMATFAVPTPHDKQCEAVEAVIGDWPNWQPSNEQCGWTFIGGIDAASFETLSIQPSVDGGTSMWHGHITNGQIVGGV